MKSNIFTALFFFISFSFFSNAQDSIRISGYFKGNTKYAKVVVNKFGDGIIPISALPIIAQNFEFKAPLTIEPGVYRLQYSQSDNEYIDVIIDGKEREISFELDVNSNNKIPFFSQSNQNINWYSYQKIALEKIKKIGSLGQLLATYPNITDKIFQQVEAERKVQISLYEKQYNEFKILNSNTWATIMVINRPYFFSNPRDDFRLQNYDARLHYWDKIDTSNPELINSPLYTEHILNYLRYYMNPDMNYSEQEMEDGFFKSVDTIIERFSKNDETKKFAIKYMQLGFKEIGQEKVLKYIDEKFASLLQCESGVEKSELQQRMSGYEALKPGVITPNITFINEQGKPTGLYDITADKTIIVFWSSECLHCMETMPKINEWAKNNPSVAVLAISIDTDFELYQNASSKLENMLHYCDYNGWESDFVKKYYIYGTPTFIVLDKEHKIIDKFINWKSVLKSI